MEGVKTLEEALGKIERLGAEIVALRKMYLYKTRVWPTGGGWVESDSWGWEVVQGPHESILASGTTECREDAEWEAHAEVQRLCLEDVTTPTLERMAREHEAKLDAVRRDFLADIQARAEEYDAWKAKADAEREELAKALVQTQDALAEARRQIRVLKSASLKMGLVGALSGLAWRR